MAENLVRYGAGLEFTGMAAIQKMRKALSDLNRIQQESYRRQTASLKAKDTALARMLQQEQKNYEIVQAAITKRHAQEEKERTRRSISAVKDRLRAEQQANNIGKARIKQAVGNITAPTGAENMRAYYQELERSERKRLGQLERYKASLSKEYLLNKDIKDLNKDQLDYRINIEQAIKQAKTADELRNAVKAERVRLRIARENTREYEKQNFLMRRMQQSSQQMAGNMVSAFAAAGIGAGITKTGQDFESINATFKAVTGSAEAAKEEIAFVRQEAVRLGSGYTEVAKAYSRFLAASKSQIGTEGAREGLTSVLEAATVIGLSQDDIAGTLKAVQQMFSKGKIQAQEYREQLGDRIPLAHTAMQEAVVESGVVTDEMIKKFGSVSAAMEKLMEQGQLYSKEVLPYFFKSLRKFASGGLEDKLKSNRVAMGQLTTAAQVAASQIFEGGWGEGLTELFVQLKNFFEENKHTWPAIGKVVGGVFKGIAWVVKNIITPTVSALGSVLNGLTELFGDFTAVVGVAFSPVFWTAAFATMRKGLISVAIAMSPLLLKFGLIATAILFVIGLLEELAELFSPTGKRTLFKDLAKPIQEMFDQIKAFFDFLKVPTHDQPIPAGSVEDARMRMYGGVKPTSSLGMGGSGYGASAMVSAPVTIQLDSKVIAEAVVTSPVGQEGVKKIIHQSRPF